MPLDCRSDSCGIFLLSPVLAAKWPCTPQSLWPSEYDKMPIFPKGSGFPFKNYLGKDDAFFSTWELTRRNVGNPQGTGPVRDIRLPIWSLSKQKAAVFTKFDPYGELFRAGAHAPLMVWLGGKSRRSEEALWKREQGMVRRGWGPGHNNRSRSMQALGKGPPPWQRTQDNVKGGTGQGAHGGDGKGRNVCTCKYGVGKGVKGGVTCGMCGGIRGGGDNKGQNGVQGDSHPGGKNSTGGKG